ncbi:hypothetical protein T265_02577 [Opisthorchis viverrini]|uniref:Reverse transcriptase/retrotransposon-derived protein RNase H-like domain-containing protein n=1 Tax=Opisthorchis viverrini TaxID=6198 RepID=A0A075AI72_OPIVI|nr:hypothetical protein T265_02577 [Opisthorchis viverrini]KER31129.1 hypothetical protein T265_02577 [Opisthorchis viverrini]
MDCRSSKQRRLGSPTCDEKCPSWATIHQIRAYALIRENLSTNDCTPYPASRYHWFAGNFAKICASLYRLTEIGRLFEQTKKCSTAFDSFECVLSSAPILTLSHISTTAGKFTLYTDARDAAMEDLLS